MFNSQSYQFQLRLIVSLQRRVTFYGVYEQQMCQPCPIEPRMVFNILVYNILCPVNVTDQDRFHVGMRASRPAKNARRVEVVAAWRRVVLFLYIENALDICENALEHKPCLDVYL